MATWLHKFPDKMMGKAVGFGKGDGLSKKRGRDASYGTCDGQSIANELRF